MFFSRGKNKVQNPLTLVDAYKDYIKNFNKEGDPYNITCIEYRNICKIYFKKVINSIIDKGIKYKLPYRLGMMYIRKRKHQRKSELFKKKIDFQKTIEFGKTIYYLNEHSSGYTYSFKWSKITALFKNKGRYRFVPSRENKRRLASKIKEGYINYLEEKH
jgi:hypothetical protein